MKWDYQQYYRQPEWFLDLLNISLEVEAEHSAKKAKQNK